MKNFSLVINAVLIVAVVVLYFFHFSGNDTNTDKNIASASPKTEASSLKVAFVNMDSLLLNYTFYKDSKELLISKQKNAEDDLASKTKALEAKAGSFQEKVQKHLVTRRQAEEMNNQLMQEQQNLLQFKDQLSYQLLSDEQVMNKQIFDSIMSFVNDYNAKHKYDLILNNTAASTILYGNKGFDITKDILQGINSRYNTKK
ncbi:MAG: hypothetical protein CSA05_03520 [Bacteroidia bacterium]|nr:MAG: hypothetical protein CSB01_02005 [Bacteroidia bacterium]PIE85864.1 MAG: hypothetical protein CSA05_03520 [Bacteroidia bacterium]